MGKAVMNFPTTEQVKLSPRKKRWKDLAFHGIRFSPTYLSLKMGISLSYLLELGSRIMTSLSNRSSFKALRFQAATKMQVSKKAERSLDKSCSVLAHSETLMT